MSDFSRRTLLQGTLVTLAVKRLHGLALPFQKQVDEDEIRAAHRLQRAFVWSQADAPNQQVFAVFRKSIVLEDAPVKAVLRIFADTRYLLWINDNYIVRGPCRFDPKRPEYDRLDVTKQLRNGKNVIAVLVHAAAYVDDYTKGDPARNFALQSARVMAHRPGLAAELDIASSIYSTDPSWRCTAETQYLPAPPTYSSWFDNIDARRNDGGWTRTDFDDSSWPSAIPLSTNECGPLQPRSIPLLCEEEILSLKLIDAKPAAITPGPLTKHLPMELSSGSEIVVDCGRQSQAYCVMHFEAEVGSRIEMQSAVRFYDSKRILADAGFTANLRVNRYTAREGPQVYMSTDTFGMKYLAIRVVSGRIKLRNLTAVVRRYPFTRLGSFKSSDMLLDTIWQICVNTIEVCSEDAHVDCADRERAQWMADGYIVGYGVSRVVLAGPGDSGSSRYADSRLLRNMLRHVALSQLPDGRLQPMRPSNYPAYAMHGVINDYSCLWVQAVAEIYRRDGDLGFVREVWPVLIKALNYYLRRVTDLGLLYASEFVYFNNPLIYVDCEGATLNAYFHRSLMDAAVLANAVRDTSNAERFASAAQQLHAAYNHHLWDEGAGSYRGAIVRPVTVPKDTPPTFSRPNPLPVDSDNRTSTTGHAAMMALYYDMVPVGNTARVLAAMRRQLPSEHPFPYSCFFWLDVLYRQDTEEMDREALSMIRARWEHMTQYETGTTSEDFTGGSFVHEAGASPAYFLNSYVLGVRTEGERESRRLVIDPRLAYLDRAEGTTLTEFGLVAVRWERGQNRLSFDIENNSKVPAEVSLRLFTATTSLTVDGNPLLQRGISAANNVSARNGRVYFLLAPGKHSGRLADAEE